ncbi:MAG: NAD/NADP octopine/nopaline dehydrogenase family protein [Armatimonadota bacterium]
MRPSDHPTDPRTTRFCVLGAGHGGTAMAAHLALKGFPIALLNRSPQRIDPIRVQGGIELVGGPASGVVGGFGALDRVTTDPGECIPDADVIMVVVPSTAHADVARMIGPHLRDGHTVVLHPGRTGGVLEFSRVLRDLGVKADINLAEAQTFIYASRCTAPAQATIFRVKNTIPVAAMPAHRTVRVLRQIKPAFRQFVPGDNCLKTSVNNIGVVFHPTITLLNVGRIESTGGGFEFYVHGVTPSVAEVLERVDAERVAVAAALGIRAMTAREWLYVAYDAPGATLYDAMRRQPGYKGIMAPQSIHGHRYVCEDVPTGLVPIASLGRMLGVPTATMDSLIQLANAVHRCDYWKTGRTVERLGLAGMSVREIRHFVLEGAPT